MSTDIRIIQAPDFIIATPEGQLDFENTKKLLVEIALVSAPLVDYAIILDCRRAQPGMSHTDLWHLAAELSSLRRAFRKKTALLCPTERFDSAGFFALCAQNRGFQVRAFTSFEDAIEWLIAKEPDA